MAVVNANGVNLHVKRMPARNGNGTVSGTFAHAEAPPTVVLLHGMVIDSLASHYLTLAPAFAAAGFDVIMYDMRGHGHSERPPSGYLLQDFVEDLDALLDRLAVAGPVHLVGYSYGGTVAFSYAAHRPDRVASVSLLESEPATEAWARKTAESLHRGVVELARESLYPELAEKYSAHVSRRVKSFARLLHSCTLAEEMPTSRVLAEAEIRSVRCPVLAVYGSESELAPQEPWLTSLLPNCRTAKIPDQEHWILIGATQQVIDLVTAWIREHAAVPSARPAPSATPAPSAKAEGS
ncbi:alpha/beta fold hydrolase [Streptomyces halobius]|uniref:Alpha/beta hydrolase n=1 Tax=Streptomyces halobius TaxID=2879846 RepID=A0ABY4M2D1_9ACTN|nr:alpha/beta hydrolase [Streptomyces halobius]UQA91924.1 alpha/beta hydrolase [Streptomyces halobius]